MTAPNIVGVTTITGKTEGVNNVTTTGSGMASNGSSSGKVFKVNALFVSNKTATDATVTVYYTESVSTTPVNYVVCQSVVIPGGTTLDVLRKAVYIAEDQRITVKAGTAASLDAVISYEEIND